MKASVAAPRPVTPTTAQVRSPSTGTMYISMTAAKPRSNERNVTSRLAGDVCPDMMSPRRTATPTLPMIHAIDERAERKRHDQDADDGRDQDDRDGAGEQEHEQADQEGREWLCRDRVGGRPHAVGKEQREAAATQRTR